MCGRGSESRLVVKGGMGGGWSHVVHMIRTCSQSGQARQAFEQSGNTIPEQSIAGDMLRICVSRGLSILGMDHTG